MKADVSSLAKQKTLADFTVGVDNVIFSVDTANNRLLILLIKRQDEPQQGHWSLPGTLVRWGESLEDAAHRILAEKIQVNNLYLEQLYSFGEAHRANAQGNRYLSVSYFALVRFEEVVLISDSGVMSSRASISGGQTSAASMHSEQVCLDSKTSGHHHLPSIDREKNHPGQGNPDSQKLTAWYPIQQAPHLAFNHQEIVDYGYQRLRSKLEYSPIAFDVLPDVFRLNDLYQFYATVLGSHFADYSNFRSRLLKLGFLADTGIKTARGAGRPATLYRFDRVAFAPFKDKPLVFI